MTEREIFLAALKLPTAAERSAFLDQACADDGNLRQQIEALLEEHEQLGSYLESPAVLGQTTDEPRRDNPGTLIGPYKLIQELGEGGMGTVFMAQQTEPVKRLVALKIIKPGMDSRQVIARFEAERQALALMDHPNIAKVLDAGTVGQTFLSANSPIGRQECLPHPSGQNRSAPFSSVDAGTVGQTFLTGGQTFLSANSRPYFVMELVKGVPITQYCDEHHLTPRQRLELFVPVCQAVQHAHQKGIIHRDLKPSNILVALYDGKPVPKVIDFGVAKAMGQQLTEQTLVTGFGTIVGTLEYMSPEQAEFNQLDIDTRSDIYSLGVVLYELLTGTTPLDRKRLKEAAFTELLRLIREQEPPKPSTRLSESKDSLLSISAQRSLEPAKLTRMVRGELDWIVMKALEKDRSRRYETASGFAQDVQRYLADEPVLACPPSTGYRLQKFMRRNKGRLIMAAVVILALTVMAGSIGWSIRNHAAQLADREQAEANRLEKVGGLARASLNLARALVSDNKLAEAREKLAQARAQLGNDEVVLSNLAAEIMVGEVELDRFQRFLNLIDQAHRADTSSLLEHMITVDGSQGNSGDLPSARSEWYPGAAVPYLLAALKIHGILERDDWVSISSGNFLGVKQVEQIKNLAYEKLLWLSDDIFRRKQDHRLGKKLSPKLAAREALVYLEKAKHAHSPTQAFYVLRSRCYKELGDEKAAQSDAEWFAKMRPTMALDHYLHGRIAFDAKKLTVGVLAFESALRLEPTHYWSMMWLGRCLTDLGTGPADFDSAARVFTGCIMKRPDHGHAYSSRALAYTKLNRLKEALADHTKAIELSPEHPQAWYNRGLAYYNLDQPDKAIADYSKAITLDPMFAGLWNNRGVAYFKAGQPDKAIGDFSRAIELDSKRYLAFSNRGSVYAKLGQLDKAVADHSSAIGLNPNHIHAWYNRGNAYRNLGQMEKAIADYSKAIKLDPKFVFAWFNRAIAHANLNRHVNALGDYSKVVELDPKHKNAWYNRGKIYSQLGKLDRAVADYSKVIELDPRDAHAWNNRGVVYNNLNQPEKAAADFSKAIELDQSDYLAWTNRGNTHGQLGQMDKAIIDFSRAIELNPKFAYAWYNRGNAYAKLGQHDRVIADHSKVIELAPNHPQLIQVYLMRGFSYLKLGQFAQAIADYQTFVKRAPTHSGGINALAWLLATCPDGKLRNPTQAIELAKKAVKLAPNAWNHWKTLGVAHYRAGNWTSTITALTKSQDLRKGGDAIEWFFLSMAQKKLGSDIAAKKAYEKGIQWMISNKTTLDKNKAYALEARRFQLEAEEVLVIKKK